MSDAKTNSGTVTLQVDVHHLARVEGHGNITIRVVDGKLAEARSLSKVHSMTTKGQRS